MSETFFTNIETQVIAGLIITAIVGLGTFITSLWICVHKQSKDIFRLKKGFILYMQLTKKYSKEQHPDSDTDYDKIIKEMMTDDKGNL
jgi:hypothetical protein